MNTAVIYYSMNGNTAYAAQKIAAELHADVIEIIPEKQYPDRGIRKFLWGGKSAVMAETPKLQPYDFSADRYDRIIFGFPVWAGNVTPPLRTFVRDNLKGLQEKRISAFACQSGSGAERAFRKLAECLGISGFDSTLILIDPKDKPKADTDDRIRSFCEACRK